MNYDTLWYVATAAEFSAGVGVGWWAKEAWQRYCMAREIDRKRAETRALFDRHAEGRIN